MAEPEELTEEQQQAAAEAEAKKKKRRILMIAAVAVLLIGGGAGGFFMFIAPLGKDVAEQEEEKPLDLSSDQVKFFKVDRLSAPLIDKNDRVIGYVQLDLQVEVSSDEAVNYLRVREPILRHAANVTLSKSGVGMAERPHQVDYDTAAEKLKEAFNSALGQPVVVAVRVQQALRL